MSNQLLRNEAPQSGTLNRPPKADWFRGKALIIISGVLLLAAGAFWATAQQPYVYDAKGKRDPFVPLIGIAGRQGSGGVDTIMTVDDISLEGIVVNPDGKRSAVINGEVMKEGQTKGRLKVITVSKNTVDITINDAPYEIKLYEESKKTEK